MATRRALWVLALGLPVCRPAWAGGPWEPDPALAARMKAAERTTARWEKAGAGAAPEMLAAVCRRDDFLEGPAKQQLVDLGARVLPQVIRASATASCLLSSTIAAMVCPNATLDAGLYGMLRDGRPRVVTTALEALEELVDREHPQPCRDRLLASAPVPLRELVRARSGGELSEALRVVARLGPAAALLVPELIATLDKEDVPGNYAAEALAKIGPAAAPAVPALTALLRRGGKWSWRAPAALAGIGPAARPSLPELAAPLKAALPHLCEKRPAYGDADVVVESVAHAAGSIGGAGTEPLVPDLLLAFERERSCLPSGTEQWLATFGALGAHAEPAAPAVLAILEDADESLVLRRDALRALEQIGTPLRWWWRVRRVRRALERKVEVFERPRKPEAAMQILPPPGPPPRVPHELALCREESDLPPLPTPADAAARDGDDGFGSCVRERLCGPDEVAYRTTLRRCCASYRAAPPWFCPR